eukprot:3847892-Lingulodinium_polyedra.AAC.1
MERASVRLASRCGGGRSIRLNHYATFAKRYTMMRSPSPSAAATARSSHARRPTRANVLAHAWSARACD